MVIEKQYTIWGCLGNVALLSLPIFFVYIIMPSSETATNWADLLLWCYISGMLLYFAVRYLSIAAHLKQRAREITMFTQAYGLTSTPGNSNSSIKSLHPFVELAVGELNNARNYRSTNHVYSKDWAYGDIAYDVYRQTKYSEYKAMTVYYAALTTKLPRALPHVFFDARKSRGRQFRFHFARSQRHSLEGDFDKHFITYFPENYTIDSMSFISPDVMQVMINANTYDIEIENDTLTLFGSMRSPSLQIPEMAEKTLAIKKELLDNIVTYRDERLPDDLGRQRVALAGATLKKSKFWLIFNIVVFIGYVLLRIFLEMKTNN